MEFKAQTKETILILLMSVVLFVTSLPTNIQQLISFLSHTRLLENRPNELSLLESRVTVLSNLLIGYAISLLVLAIFSYRYSLTGTTIISQLNMHLKDIYSKIRNEIISSIRHYIVPDNGVTLLILALFIGSALRCYFLSQPMRYDESVTFMKFVNRDLPHLFYYSAPNNHVLHTIFVKVSTLIWGGHPASIRFPAFLAGVAQIPLIFYLCRSFKQSGLFASIAVAVFPYLVLYSTNARGYSLFVLLALGLAFSGARAAKKPSVLEATLFSLFASFGVFTIPSMFFPIAGIYCWVVCLLFINGQTLKTILFKFIIPSGIMTIAITVILYTPVIFFSNGIKPIIANRFVESEPGQEFINQMYSHFQGTFITFIRDIPASLLLVSMVLLVFGFYGSIKKRNWSILLILPSMFFGSAIIFLIKQKIPSSRTWIYIIPFMFIVADFGFTYLTELLSPKVKSLTTVASVIVGIVMAVSLISTNRITKYPDTGAFAEAQIAVQYLKPILTTNDIVYVHLPADWPVKFYLWYHSVPDIRADINHESQKEFFIVKKSRYSIMDMTDKQVIELFNLDDLALYQAVCLPVSSK
jgi:hypothetical protein